MVSYWGKYFRIITYRIFSVSLFSVMKNHNQVEKGYKDYVKSDYTQVLNDYKDLNGKNLDKEALYIYAKVMFKRISRD